MLGESEVAKWDKNRLFKLYDSWPEHFANACNLAINADLKYDTYRSIAFCGMGGSATSCDVLNDLLSKFGNIPSSVIRGQEPPLHIDKKSLVIVNSVSGNTRETIDMMKKALARKADVICVSSGGKLREFSEKNGVKHINVPNLKLPRASLPYLLVPVLRLIDPFLSKSINQELKTISRKLVDLSNIISVSAPEKSNLARKVASFLFGGSTFCFTSPYLLSVGTRFKNSLNENAKVHCFRESILEASHNEIVPFTYDNNLESRIIFVRGFHDQKLVDERFDKVESFFRRIRLPVMEVRAPSNGILTSILSLIYILDYATLYLAITRNIDPTPTPAIEILKNNSV